MKSRNCVFSISAVLILAACSGSADTSTDTDTPDLSSDTAAPEPELPPVDVATPDVAPDTHDTHDTPDTDVEPEVDTGPTTAPFERGVGLDWAIQSTTGQIERPVAIGLADGGLAFVAHFSGTVTLGAYTVTASAESRTHTLFGRVDANGEVTALTRLCDRCAGLGQLTLTELPFGKVGFAAVSEGEVVVNPGSDAETRRVATYDLFVGVISTEGRLNRWAFLGSFDGWGEVGALAALPGEGLVIAGSGYDLSLNDAPGLDASVPEADERVSRAFIVGVSSDLVPTFAERFGGSAWSGIHLLHATGDSLVAVGDFGGWSTMSALFGVGLENQTELDVVSATEDPANDLFMSRWSMPESRGRLALGWVKRIAHRSDGPRESTWIRSLDMDSHDGGFEFRLERAATLVPDGTGQFQTESPSAYDTRLVVRVDGDGAATALVSTIAAIQPRPHEDDLLVEGASDGYLSASDPSTDATTLRLIAEGGPAFTIPEAESPTGLTWEGIVIARWLANGSPFEAGLLPIGRPKNLFTPDLRGAFPQADGSVLLLLWGSSPLTFAPTDGAPVTLENSAAIGRVVVARVRLD